MPDPLRIEEIDFLFEPFASGIGFLVVDFSDAIGDCFNGPTPCDESDVDPGAVRLCLADSASEANQGCP